MIAAICTGKYINHFLSGRLGDFHTEAEMGSAQPVEPDQVETCGGNKVRAPTRRKLPARRLPLLNVLNILRATF